MPDLEDIQDAVNQAGVDPATASVDGQSASSHPLPDLIALEKHVANRGALTGTNTRGGPKSPWNNSATRAAVVTLPGTVGR